MTPEQQEQWARDVAEFGPNAYQLWEFCLYEDLKQGKVWRPAICNEHHVLRNRECRRITDKPGLPIGYIRGPFKSSPGNPMCYQFAVFTGTGWIAAFGETEAQARAEARRASLVAKVQSVQVAAQD